MHLAVLVGLGFVGLGFVGCGRINFDQVDAPNGTEAVKVCETVTIVSGPVPDPAIDLSFVPTDTGFTALWNVIDAGGIDGINLTPELVPDVVTTASPRNVIDLVYRSNSAVFSNGELMCAPTLASAQQTFIKIVNRDLTGYVETALLSGRDVAAPFGNLGMDRYAFLVDTGLVAHELDPSWTPTGGMMPLPGTATEGAMVQAGLTVVLAWSAPDECSVGSLPPVGFPRVAPAACAGPRLVQIGIDDFGLVFERDGKIQLGRGDAGTLDSMAAAPLTNGSSPRIIHDGVRFWLAWLDGGTLHVGFSDGTRLTGFDTRLAAAPSAYELILVDGAPQLIAITSAGMTRRTLCIPG